MTVYGVTGATGHLGTFVITGLLAAGVEPGDIVAVARSSSKARDLIDRGVTVRIADYETPEALADAFAGVERLVMISGSEVGARAQQHANVVDAAVAAGVGLIAYTSLLSADTSKINLAEEHRFTEKYIKDSGIDHIFLRNGWYSENYAGSYAGAVQSGTLYGCAGEGKIAPASREDYALAAAIAVTKPEPGRIYELAGSEHLTLTDVAKAFTDVAKSTGENVGEISYVDLGFDGYHDALAKAQVPEPLRTFLPDWDAGIERGDLDSDSRDLQDLLGTESTPFEETLAKEV